MLQHHNKFQTHEAFRNKHGQKEWAVNVSKNESRKALQDRLAKNLDVIGEEPETMKSPGTPKTCAATGSPWQGMLQSSSFP